MSDDDLQKYEDLVPESLAKDQKKLKSVSNKVLPFVFEELVSQSLVMKDAKGKKRERFLDLLMLNYTRLGKPTPKAANESFIKDIVSIKEAFAETLKLIPQEDDASAFQIGFILAKAEVLISYLRESNDLLVQKELNAKIAATKNIDASNNNNLTLIDKAIVDAYDRAIEKNVINLETANLEKKTIFPTPSIVTGKEKVATTESTQKVESTESTQKVATTESTEKVEKAEIANKTATATSNTTNEPGATTDLSKKTNILPESKEQKAEPIDVEPVGPTEPYTPPGVDVDVKKAEEKAFQNSMHEPSTKILGIDVWQFIGFAFGIAILIASIVSFFYLRTTAEVNYDSKEEKNLSETKKTKDGNK